MVLPSRLDARGLEEAIYLLDREHQPPFFQIRLAQNNGYDNLNSLVYDFHRFDWERLGGAIARNTTVSYLSMDRDCRDTDISDIMMSNNNIGSEVFQCIDALYRGLQLNTSINHLVIDMDLFPCDGSLPTLNLHEQFKENLKHLGLESRITISNNQSDMIESLLESTSLERFSVRQCTFGTSDAAFRKILLACSKTKHLILNCATLSQCSSVANLLGDPRSVLSVIDLSVDIDEGGLSGIAVGLANNKTLKKLYFRSRGDSSPITQVLCDTSNIERIIASNHMLESAPYQKMPPYIQDYLMLNEKTNKELVIRTKIAWYYFQGEFDVTTLASMDMKCLPAVLAMIGGGETNRNAVSFRKGDAVHQQSAIFRLLKCLPDLCNVSSRNAGQSDGNGARDGSLNKRQKVSK